jgi:hypothetical protein
VSTTVSGNEVFEKYPSWWRSNIRRYHQKINRISEDPLEKFIEYSKSIRQWGNRISQDILKQLIDHPRSRQWNGESKETTRPNDRGDQECDSLNTDNKVVLELACSERDHETESVAWLSNQQDLHLLRRTPLLCRKKPEMRHAWIYSWICQGNKDVRKEQNTQVQVEFRWTQILIH